VISSGSREKSLREKREEGFGVGAEVSSSTTSHGAESSSGGEEEREAGGEGLEVEEGSGGNFKVGTISHEIGLWAFGR
jgi:hypothetical protein